MPHNEGLPEKDDNVLPTPPGEENVNENDLQDNALPIEETPLEPALLTDESPAINMEVHHHPDLHHKPKPFKEFVLEFIMIFLAVTLGFFAESYREYLGERAKEKEAIHSLIEDLEIDTTQLTQFIQLHNANADTLNLLVKALNSYNGTDSANHKLYQLYLTSTITAVFFPAERTLTQLKNTGAMHIIKNKAVADELVDYDIAIKKLDEYVKVYNDYSKKCVDQAANIFNLNFLKYYADMQESATIDTSLVVDPAYRNRTLPLINTDPKILLKYANSVWYEQLVILNYSQNLMEFKKQETRFIALLRKEYNIAEKE